MAVIAQRILDGAVLGLVKQWLKAPVVEEDGQGRQRTVAGKAKRRGTPQGGVISPLLANLYLHLMDRIWQRHNLERRLGARLVRYCDDFVVLCRSDISRPLGVIEYVMGRLGLRLNEEKTRLVDAGKKSFDFLGFSFIVRRSRKSGKRYPHVEPSKKSAQRLRLQVKQMTDRRMTPIALPEVMASLNRVLRGWSNYYHYRNCTSVFNGIKWYTEERVRTHLRKRHKVKSRAKGYRLFTNRRLYDHYGLFKLPTTAVWR